ncbi:MAG: hypothetical protein K1W13_07870 [Lachnospiraceae bacterium]
MKNRIVYVNEQEADAVKAEALQKENVFFAELDGRSIQTEADYVREMELVMNCPYEKSDMYLKLGWYHDWICELLWLGEKDVVLLLRGYDFMLRNNEKTKKRIVEDFEEITLPWWEGEVIGHMVGGKPRSFMVYLEGKAS